MAESVDSLQAALRDVLINLRQHPSAWPFREPVDGKEVPDYYKVITDPIGTPLPSPLRHLTPHHTTPHHTTYNTTPHTTPHHYSHYGFNAIDLKTIQRRLDAGNFYITRELFLADVKRMCNNCRTYNAKDTVYYKCADDMEKRINEIFFSDNNANNWERPKRQAKENALKFV